MWINFSLINDCSLRVKKKRKTWTEAPRKGEEKTNVIISHDYCCEKREGKLWRANCEHNEKVVFLDGASHKTTRMFLNEIQKMNKLLSMKKALKLNDVAERKTFAKLYNFRLTQPGNFITIVSNQFLCCICFSHSKMVWIIQSFWVTHWEMWGYKANQKSEIKTNKINTSL